MSELEDALAHTAALEADNERLRAALEPFARGLAMYESECRLHGWELPEDEAVAKYVYVGDQRKARRILDGEKG